VISVITAVYNQLPVNRLYVENLKRYTHFPYELIIIDNGSDDGSAEFFERSGATVIRNGANYSYPHCQNQGIRAARYDLLAFLNNDLIVGPDWDRLLVESMRANGLEAVTGCGVEGGGDRSETRRLKLRWSRIKNLVSLFGQSYTTLKWMHQWMYHGRWEEFCRERAHRYHGQVAEGFVGHTVLMTRASLEKVGMWDETQQGADYDLYLRTKERSMTVGDIRPLHYALDVFVHHYIRLTSRKRPPPFVDRANLSSIRAKWGAEKERWADAVKQ